MNRVTLKEAETIVRKAEKKRTRIAIVKMLYAEVKPYWVAFRVTACIAVLIIPLGRTIILYLLSLLVYLAVGFTASCSAASCANQYTPYDYKKYL